MKIGVMADTHDNLDAIKRAVEFLNKEQVELVLHAGDYVAPFAVKALGELNCKVIGIFGNNDGEKIGLSNVFQHVGEIHNGPHVLEAAGKAIMIVHDPAFADALAKSCDVLVCGHAHEPTVRKVADSLILNPGECGGWLTGRCTIAVLSTDDMNVDIIEI